MKKNVTFWQKVCCFFSFHETYRVPFNKEKDKLVCFHCSCESLTDNLEYFNSQPRGWRYCENCGEREDKCPCGFWHGTC